MSLQKIKFIAAAVVATAIVSACSSAASVEQSGKSNNFIADPASVEANGWTPERFKQWVDSRAGTGEPVYWYSTGTLRTFPEGELIYTLEGYDTARSETVSDTLTRQFSRKIYIYRDAQTGEIVKTVGDTDVEPIAYPYQYITYEYKTDKDEPYLQTFVEQGRAPRIQKIGPGTDITVRQFGDVQLYTAPLFLDFPIPNTDRRYQTFENYDFVIPNDADGVAMITFMRYGPLPAWAQKDGVTMGAMHMQTWRIADYEDVPQGFREFIEAEAPLWKEPPLDLEDIRRLQEPASE